MLRSSKSNAVHCLVVFIISMYYVPFSSAEMYPMLSTLSGNGTASSTGTGGPASAMTLNGAGFIWEDSVGAIYVGEYYGNCVRKFAYPNGIVSNVAGVCGRSYNYRGDGGPATSAVFSSPSGVVVDTIGQMFVADFYNMRIRKVSTSGIITNFAGNGRFVPVKISTAATSSTFYCPVDLWIDSISQLYVSVSDDTLRKIDTNTGYHTLIAGVAFDDFYSGDGGPATSAGLSCNGISGGDSGGVYFSDYVNYRIRYISNVGIITTVIGTGNENGTYSGEGVAATSCNIVEPSLDVLCNVNGDIYFTNSYRIQNRNSLSHNVTTIVGNGVIGYTAMEKGLPTNISINPHALYMTTDQVLLFTDYDNAIRQVQFGPSDSDDDVISDSSDSSHSSSSSAALSFGGIVGIVIAVAVIVGCIVAVWKSKPNHSHAAAVVVPVTPSKESELVEVEGHNKVNGERGNKSNKKKGDHM